MLLSCMYFVFAVLYNNIGMMQCFNTSRENSSEEKMEIKIYIIINAAKIVFIKLLALKHTKYG